MPYIYLIKPAEFIDTECYKVGLSSKCDLNRLKSYGAGTEYIQYFSCKNFEQAEKEIIFNLNQCVKSGKNIKLFKGKEYFAEDKKVILKIFVKVMNKYVQMDLDNEASYRYNTCFDGLVFTCVACDYNTKVKCNFIKHVNSKKHKEKITSDKVCDFCFKKFVTVGNTNRHIKSCKHNLNV